MPYFPVDDGFSSHPKVTRLRRGPTRERAVGLWTLAGSWCAFNLTDGQIPRTQVEELGCTKVAAQWLVDVTLWHSEGHDCPVCPQPEAGGWVFHEWAASGRNFTREAVLQRRAAKAAAGAKGGLRSGQTRRAATKQPATNSEAPASQLVEPPSHPIPTQEQTPPTTSSSGPPETKPARGHRLPDEFPVTDEMRDWARSKTPDVPASEHERFCDYWRAQPGAKGRKTDWVATWRNWMRKAADDIASGRRAPAGGRRSTTDERVAQAASLMDRARELDERDAAQGALVIEMGDRRALGG